MNEKEKDGLERELSQISQQIKDSPGNLELYFFRGNLYKQLGRNEEALLDYNKVIEFNPNFADVYYSRGNVLAALKKYPEAVEDFNQAITLKAKG